MTPEQLEKLAIARQKALDKKKMLREVAEAEKEFKKYEFEEKYKKVQEIKKTLEEAKAGQTEAAQAEPEAEPDINVDEDSDSEEDVLEEVIVKKTPSKTKSNKKGKYKKVLRRIVEVSSSSSDDSSSDEELEAIKTIGLHLKRKYKDKYKGKYTKQVPTQPQERDLLKEEAGNVIRANVSKELRRLALNSVFPE
jgi:hypothetical protein